MIRRAQGDVNVQVDVPGIETLVHPQPMQHDDLDQSIVVFSTAEARMRPAPRATPGEREMAVIVLMAPPARVVCRK